MLRRFQSFFSGLSRKARRAGKTEASRLPSKVRLFLSPLEVRLVPSATASEILNGTTLTVTEFSASNDSIQETSFGKYTVIDSAGTFNFSNVSNLVFNANTTGVEISFLTPEGSSITSGNVSVNGNGQFIGLDVVFQVGLVVDGAVTVKDTGAGSSSVVNVGADTFGSLSVTGGSAVTAPNQFVPVNDSIQGNVFTGTDVDLEGSTIDGSATINVGAGGGEVTLASTYNGSPTGNAVKIDGNLSVTDLRSLTNDSFYAYNSTVLGNVTYNVSLLTSTYDNAISFQNDTFAKNLSVSASVTGGGEGLGVLVDNSSIAGNLTINQSGNFDYAYAEVDYSSIGGNLIVTQPAAYSDVFNAYGNVTTFLNSNSDQFYNDATGTPNNSIGGAVTIKQTAANDEAYLVSFASIKGAVTLTQTGAEGSFAYIENDPLLKGSITVNQTSISYNNSIFINNDQTNGSVTVNQATSTYSNYNSNSSGYVFSIYPGTYIDNDAINGSVAINQTIGNGILAYADLGGDIINGSITIKQASGFSSETDLYNSSVGGAVALYQGPDSGYDDAYLDTVQIKGAVTINQGAAQGGDYAEIANNSSVNSSVTAYQLSLVDNNFEVYYDTTIVGKLFVGQAASGSTNVYIQGSEYDYNTSTYLPGNVSILGGLTIQEGAGYNHIDITDAVISGPVTINQGLFGVGYNEVEFGSDSEFNTSSTVVSGTVTVQQGDGEDAVYLGNDEPTSFSATTTFTANASAYAFAYDYSTGHPRTFNNYSVTT